MEFSNKPNHYLKKLRKADPELWKLTALAVSEARKEGFDWPNTCLVPFTAFYAMALKQYPDDLYGSCAPIYSALVQWSYSQGIYEFDRDTMNALAETLPSQNLPVDVLLRLPEYCIYVQTTGLEIGLDMNLSGFWAHIDHDIDENKDYLRILLNVEAYGLTAFSLELGNWPPEEGLSKAFQRQKDAWSALIAQQLRQNNATALRFFSMLDSLVNPLISMLLYLCQEEPEIDGNRVPGSCPKHEASTKVTKSWRWSPAVPPRIWSVGTRIGALLRQAVRQRGKGSAKATHLRRGHWHAYWRGPRDGERKLVYRWLPPMMIAVPEAAE